MNEYLQKTIKDLEDEINELDLEQNDSIVLYEVVIELILKKLAEVKQYVLSKGFKTVEEEIHFFKKLKPIISSKLIYYNNIYKIETKKPYGGEKTIKKHLNNELSKIKRYFDNNLDFYKYYRTNSTYLDHKYFVRGKYDIKLSLDTYYFESDHKFSTTHDFKVAKIMANDLLQLYLENQIFAIHGKLRPGSPNVLKWTGSKTALIELIYSLYTQSVFDNGNADIKSIVKYLENVFDISLGDFYHTFLELKNRKTNRTKFLDALKEGLLRKMDDQDEE